MAQLTGLSATGYISGAGSASSLINGGEASQYIKYNGNNSINCGSVVFKISRGGTSAASRLTGMSLTYEEKVESNGFLKPQVSGFHTWKVYKMNPSSISGSVFVDGGSTQMANEITDRFDSKIDGDNKWFERTKNFEGIKDLSFNNDYMTVNWGLTESNNITHMTCSVRYLKLNLYFDEKYYANFKLEDGTVVETQTVNSGSSPNFPQMKLDYYNFIGWKDYVTGQIYTTSLPAGTNKDVTYIAQFEKIKHNIIFDYNGGKVDNNTSHTYTVEEATESTTFGGNVIYPQKSGYKFIGWDLSGINSIIGMDFSKGYSQTHDLGWEVSINADHSTKYKLNPSNYNWSQSSYDYPEINFKYYGPQKFKTVTFSGQIKIISNPDSNFLNLYNTTNGEGVIFQSTDPRCDGQWHRFSFTTTTSNEFNTGYFTVRIGSDLSGTSQPVEFDLREIKIVTNIDGIISNVVHFNRVTQDLTLKALYRESNYITYDSYFNYKKYRDQRLSGASGGSISNITDVGFVLNSTSGDAYTYPFSQMFYLEQGKDYTIAFNSDTTNSNVFIFFYDQDGNDAYNYTLSPVAGYFSNEGEHTYTFNAKSSYCRFRVGTTVNGNNVHFYNFRLYPADKEYANSTIGGSNRFNTEATLNLPTPSRNHYSFLGWNSKIDGTGKTYTSTTEYPTEDMFLWSQWEINQYKATFLNYDGTIFKEIYTNYNEVPSLSDIPKKPSSEKYHYVFTQWTDLGPITQDTTYSPVFVEEDRYYDVIWYDDDGITELEKDYVKYGDIPTYDGSLPTKPPTAQYTYTFSGWHIEIVPVESNIIYKATYSKTVNLYDVMWVDWDGTVLKIDKDIPYGDIPVFDYPLPTRPPDKKYTYTFYDWDATPEDPEDTGVGSVQGHVTYTAIYTREINKYQISLLTNPPNGGIVKGGGFYDYGSKITISAFPSSGFGFNKWDDNNTERVRVVELLDDITYVANFNRFGLYYFTQPIKKVFLYLTDITNNIHIYPQ